MNNTGTKEYWSLTEGVFNCLIDSKRTSAFSKAIKKAVSEGDIVVDMGTGSGVLAIKAVEAGAKRVYAIENDENNVKTLTKTFLENNVSDKIVILNKSVLEVTIPEKVDIIIGEMIATALLEELQLFAMNHILKFGKKDCKVLLNKYETYIDVVFNNEKFYGNTFKIYRYEYPDEPSLKSNSFSEKESLVQFDFSKKNKKTKIAKSITIKIKKNGIINALRLSGETTFFDNSKLKSTFAYDYPLILPIKTMSVKKGEILDIMIKYEVGAGLSSLKYNVLKHHE